jgi:hypothetical protein
LIWPERGKIAVRLYKALKVERKKPAAQVEAGKLMQAISASHNYSKEKKKLGERFRRKYIITFLMVFLSSIWNIPPSSGAFITVFLELERHLQFYSGRMEVQRSQLFRIRHRTS